MTRQLRVVDPQHVAFDMESDVRTLRDLGYAVYASAHAISLENPLRTVFEQLGLLIHDKAIDLEEQRCLAAGQRVDSR
jgi:hypothetical protein